MEEDSEDRRCGLRSQPHRCRQSETRSPQIKTLPSTQRRRTTASNVSLMSTDIPGSNRTCWTSSNQLRLSNCTNYRPPAAESSSSPPPPNSDNSSEPPLSSSSTAPTTAAQATVTRAKTDTITTSPDSSDDDQDYTCPHCDRTFTSRIGLVGYLRIHRTETGEPVPEHQPTPTALASTAHTVHTALASSVIAWVYSATCAFTRAELTTIPTHQPHPTHPPRPVPPSLHRPARRSPPPSPRPA
nr:unnamed protein product [Spirometra erinaceieuropaei]